MKTNIAHQRHLSDKDELTKFANYALGKGKLADRDLITYARIKSCFEYLSKGINITNVVKLIVEEYSLQTTDAYQYIFKSLKVFGVVFATDKQGVKAVERENYMRLAMMYEDRSNKADSEYLKSKYLELGLRCRENASKIAGVFEKEVENNIQVNLPSIVLSGDSQLLQSNVKDIDHEEI